MTLVGEVLAEGIDPSDLAPGVVFEREVKRARTLSGHNYERRFVAVGDVSRPEDRARMNNRLGLWDDILIDNPDWPIPDYGKGIKNPASDAFYEDHLTGTSMQYWRDNHMPNAPALYPLQVLEDAGRLFPGGTVDDHAMDIFTNAVDSIAIRARGSIHNALLLKKAADFPEDTLTAVALGAGAGVPNINATLSVKETYGKSITWNEYDTNYESLKLNKELFKEHGIPEEDVYTGEGRRTYEKAFELEDGSVDIIDMLGLWEYLSTERCEKAVEELYKKLKPGGIFVVSNMLSDRPELAINQRAIGWKGVKPRTIDELIDIAAKSIDTENITITTSDDGVYAVMEIHKPL